MKWTYAMSIVVALGGVAVACRSEPSPSASSASAAPTVPFSASAVASSRAPAEDASPLTGKWKGSFEVKAYTIAMTREEGAVPAWTKDPGSDAVGKGSLELQISGDGRVTGSAKGPLGDLQASGAAEEDAVRVHLLPVEPGANKAFSGHMVLTLTKGRLSGAVQASTGDSLVVRAGQAELSRGP